MRVCFEYPLLQLPSLLAALGCSCCWGRSLLVLLARAAAGGGCTLLLPVAWAAAGDAPCCSWLLALLGCSLSLWLLVLLGRSLNSGPPGLGVPRSPPLRPLRVPPGLAALVPGILAPPVRVRNLGVAPLAPPSPWAVCCCPLVTLIINRRPRPGCAAHTHQRRRGSICA